MAIIVNTPEIRNQAIYTQGHTHSISEQGDLTIIAETGSVIGVHNRNQWISIQYGEIAQPAPTEETK